MHKLKLAGLIALCTLGCNGAMAEPRAPLFTPSAPLAAPDGRWDFASWDEPHHRLLVAHGKDVLVIDPSRAGEVRVMGDLSGAHQALAIPGGDHLLVTSGHDNTVRIFDGPSGGEIARIPVAKDPDAAILSADGHRAYVMASEAGAVSVVDLDKQAEVARIAVKPGLEVPVWIDSGTLAINDEDASEIELVDTVAGKHTGAIALPGCEGPTGLAYAAPFHMGLSACANGKAALVDMARRRLVKLVPIGLGPDTAIWDARAKRFLVPCGKSGTLSVIGPDGTPLGSSVTAPAARTAALDPATGRVYLPAADFAPAAPGQRPAIIPGSFRIIVLNPAE